MGVEVMSQIASLNAPEIIAASPYLYVTVDAGPEADRVAAILAGTWLDQVARMNSWWSVEGEWAGERGNLATCMVGRDVARRLRLSPGSGLTVRYAGRQAQFTVAGVITAGDSEDSQIFVDLAAAQALTQLERSIGFAQVSVRGTSPVIEDVMRRLAAAVPVGHEVRAVRQLEAAEGPLLDRIRGLLFATLFLILLLSSLVVLAATAGLAIERRRDVGLMRALGGSVRQIMRIFLFEAAAVGFAGGLLGAAAGMLLTEWIGQRVFHASIGPRLIVLPFTVLVMTGVAMVGALPLRLLGRVRPAEILRNE
jgi:putative ABC transport system permease protein